MNGKLETVAIRNIQTPNTGVITAVSDRAYPHYPESFVRLPEVKKITGLSRSSIYEYIRQGHFPQQIPLGGRVVGWRRSQVSAWVEEKIAHGLERETSVGGSHE